MCEHCNGDVNKRKSLLEGECDSCDSTYHVYIDGNNNLTDNLEDCKINYCPMCGRKLGD